MANTKLRQQQNPNIQAERKLAALKAQAVKEQAFKLVVKIISWESGSLESLVIKSANKITPDEWLQYKEYRMNLSTTPDKEKVRDNLIQTYNSIKANGGFK